METEPSPVLFYFKATPDHIAPFQSSTLSWNAALPDGFTLTLNNAWVPQAGEQVVQAVMTANYTIRALHGGSETALGYVTVSVDNTCVQQVKQDVQNPLQFALVAAFDIGSAMTSAHAKYSLPSPSRLVYHGNVLSEALRHRYQVTGSLFSRLPLFATP